MQTLENTVIHPQGQEISTNLSMFSHHYPGRNRSAYAQCERNPGFNNSISKTG